jgi:tetratricopeptide (TPR) repeat protein
LSLATCRACLKITAMSGLVVNREDRVPVARSLCERGQWPEVLAFARQWHLETPADYRALYYAGLGFSGTGQFADAEAAYRLALTLDSSDFKVWNNLGGLLFERLRRQAEGVQCLEQALQRDPGNQLGWANLAVMVGRLGRHNDAITYANRALEIDPQMVEALLHKGHAAWVLGKIEIVREVCAALAAIKPEKFRRSR